MDMRKIIALVLIIGFISSIYNFSTIPANYTEIPLEEKNFTSIFGDNQNLMIEKRVAILRVPAVDNQGNGVATILKVEALPGEGRVLTNINQLLFWVDTQHSIQVAKEVAGNLTKTDFSKIDLIYTIETEASLIEGPSAGAALAIATIAVLKNRSLNPSVSITGTINPDGTLGPVGGILAKTKASTDVGVNLFLVPKGQGLQTVYKPIKQCEKIGAVTYCTIRYERESIDITKQSDLQVIEVENVQEALKYFLA